jgi:ATP dependent DNA ligase domain
VLATPPVYVAFDVLYARGEDLRARPLAARREMLEEIVDDAGSVFVVPRLSANRHEAWAEGQRRGLEGFVAKDPASRYLTGGPTRSWLKVKVRHEAPLSCRRCGGAQRGLEFAARQRGAAAPTVSRPGTLSRSPPRGGVDHQRADALNVAVLRPRAASTRHLAGADARRRGQLARAVRTQRGEILGGNHG